MYMYTCNGQISTSNLKRRHRRSRKKNHRGRGVGEEWGVLTAFIFLQSTTYFTEGGENLPPWRSNWIIGSNSFLREVRTSISKETYSHLLFSRGLGCPDPLPLLWIRPWNMTTVKNDFSKMETIWSYWHVYKT